MTLIIIGIALAATGLIGAFVNLASGAGRMMNGDMDMDMTGTFWRHAILAALVVVGVALILIGILLLVV